MTYIAEQARLSVERGKRNASSTAIDAILNPLSLSKKLPNNFTFKARSYIANGILKISKKLLLDNKETTLRVNELPVGVLLAYAAQVQAILDYENGITPNFPR